MPAEEVDSVEFRGLACEEDAREASSRESRAALDCAT